MRPMRRIDDVCHPLVGGGPYDFDECWQNGKYEVLVKRDIKPGESPMVAPAGTTFPPITWLSIKRMGDKECIRDWRHLQEIKNDICGVDAEGVELYPKEDRKMDGANQFHIWVLPPGQGFPFGFPFREVLDSESVKREGRGAVQRRFRSGDRYCETTKLSEGEFDERLKDRETGAVE